MSKTLRGQTCLEAGHVQNTSGPDLSRGQTCPKHFRAGLVSRPDMSKTLRGRTCPKHFGAGLVSRPDMSKNFEAGLVPNTLRPDLSRGWTCPGLISGPDLSSLLEARLVQSIGGRTCLKAGLGLGPDLSWSCRDLSRDELNHTLARMTLWPGHFGQNDTKFSLADIKKIFCPV